MKTLIRQILSLSILCSFLLLSYNQLTGQCVSPEYLALKAIYDANPGNTTGWDLNNCDVCTWEYVGCSLGSVDSLNLRNKNLTLLPPEIGSLTQLTFLDLAFNNLPTLPSEIGDLINAEIMYLDHLHLTTLPPEIGNLGSLIQLELWQNELATLPAEIGNLGNLELLNLALNNLATIPPEIGNLISLQRLFLIENNLSSIPDEIGNLSNLIRLDLSRNDFVSISSVIGNLTTLTSLQLNSNSLTTIPAEIGNLTSLLGLNLSFNNLTTLPDEIGYLVNLISLDMSRNELTSIPFGIGNMTQLFELYMSQNQISTIPSGIGYFQNLDRLRIQSNLITCLPESFFNLCGITAVRVAPNPANFRFFEFCADSIGVCDPCIYVGDPFQTDSDCDGITDQCDLYPGVDDTVDNNDDGLADAGNPPVFDDIIDEWKCGNNKVLMTVNLNNPHTICVNKNAISAHIANGGYLGPLGSASCNQNMTAPSITDIPLDSGFEFEYQANVYPNPAEGEITIVLPEVVEVISDIFIYNQMGQVLYQAETQQNSLKIDISGSEFINGIYQIMIRQNENSSVLRFVVMKE